MRATFSKKNVPKKIFEKKYSKKSVFDEKCKKATNIVKRAVNIEKKMKRSHINGGCEPKCISSTKSQIKDDQHTSDISVVSFGKLRFFVFSREYIFVPFWMDSIQTILLKM